MSTSAPERPEFTYASAGRPPAPPPDAPAERPQRRHGPRRTAALLLCGALLCSGTGAATALLVDGDELGTGPSTATITRSSGAAQPAGTPAAGTAQSAAATIAPSVVTIAVTTGAGRPSGGRGTSGTGSGIVLRSDGTVLTNHHVVAGATRVEVTFEDGSTAPARVVGTDPTSDLAVVRVEGRRDLTAAVFADSDELAVGQAVLAVGAPLGLSNTVTEGIVSTLDRPVRTGDTASEQSVIDAVQTDAAINPGNSGGALVDLEGRVVGVNSAIATAGNGSGNIGVGFAIPSNDAVAVAEQLIADGTADHPLLGVDVGQRTSAAPAGAVLTGVTAGGSAAAAGLRAGDVVAAVAGRAVVDADSLVVAVRDHAPGATVEVEYTRDGRSRTTEATLGSSD